MTQQATNRTVVGFVGLGQMGKPMALNLIQPDTDLRVISKVHSPYAEMRAAGAATASSPAEITDARIVFLSLPGTAAVLDVLFGETGLAKVLQPGAIVVDTSTIEHGATMDIHARLASTGIGFLDAPVSGMQARAEDGTLTVMCGGAQDAFNIVKPWLERIGNNILYMGGPGSGQLTKLVNQLLFDINCAALAEILPMSTKMGLDPEKIASVINSGTGRSYATEFFLPRILKRHFSDGYPLKAAYKDLVSAAELGARNAIPMPVLAAATATYQMSLLAGHGERDKGAMTRLFEDMLDVQFRAGVNDSEIQHG